MKQTFSVNKAFESGFALLSNNIGVFAAVFGIVFGFRIVFWGIDSSLGFVGLNPSFAISVLPIRLIVEIVFPVASLLLAAGLLKVILQVHDGKNLDVDAAIKELFINYKYIGIQVLAVILVCFIFVGLWLMFFAVLGLTLLAPYLNLNAQSLFGVSNFISGLGDNHWVFAELIGISLIFLAAAIYLLTRISFYMFLIVDKNLGPVESIKKSFEITSGNFWKLIGLYLVSLGVIILGLLCCCIGVLAAIPICMVAYAHVYRKLSAEIPPLPAGQNP